MKCMYCGATDSKVIDSRQSEDGTSIRRRRECIACGKRFTTYETVEHTPIMVIKKNGEREPFDVDKLKRGIIRAIEKRPVSIYQVETLVEEIQKLITNSLKMEISSREIGELVMDGLKDIDDVAYVRFASVYRQFKDINTFLQEIEELMSQADQKKKLDDKKG